MKMGLNRLECGLVLEFEALGGEAPYMKYKNMVIF